MHRSQRKLAFEIVYVSPQKWEIREEFELSDSYLSQGMKLHVIYQHVNKFLDRHEQIKEFLTIENQGRSGKQLLFGGLHCQDGSNPGFSSTREIIKIVLKPVIPRTQLLDQINQFKARSDLARINQACETQQPSYSLRSITESAYSQREGEIKIGVLFGDPLTMKSRGSLVPLESGPISFEHEIHRIIKKTKNKRVTVISRVATLDNLRDLLKEGINILHISCHGKIRNQKFYLSFERSEEFGVEDLIPAEKLCECIKQTDAKLSCLILMACYSSSIGQYLYNELKIPLVVSIKDTETIYNTASEIYSDEFYEKMLSMSYRECLKCAREAVKKHYKHCCCAHNYRQESCEGHNPCNNLHFLSCACPSRERNIHSARNCTKKDEKFQSLKKIPLEKDPNSFMVCCCRLNHYEGDKIIEKLNPDFEDKNIVSGLKDQVSNDYEDSETADLLRNYYIPAELMNQACKKICQGTNLMAVVGEPRSGKTYFVRKMVSYIMQRVRRGAQSYYGLYIYLNMSKYSSWLNFQISASCKRKYRLSLDGDNECVGLARVIEYARSQSTPCFFVLDHCNHLAERNRISFLELINRYLARERLPDAKIILLANKTPAFEAILASLSESHRADFYIVKMKLGDEEKREIMFEENRAYVAEWRGPNSPKNLFSCWAPDNLDELKAFKPPRQDIINEEKLKVCLRAKILERQQFNEERRKFLSGDSFLRELQPKEVLLFRVLALFPEVFEWSCQLSQSTAQQGVVNCNPKVLYLKGGIPPDTLSRILKMLKHVSNVNHNPHEYWKRLVLESLKNTQLSEVLYSFVQFCCDFLGCLMESISSKEIQEIQEEAFEMAPEAVLIEPLSPQKPNPQRQILSDYIRAKTSVAKKIDTIKKMVKGLSSLELPLDFCMERGGELLRSMLVTAPFLCRIIEQKPLRDQSLIHEAIHCLELVRDNSTCYQLAMTDLVFMLGYSRSQVQHRSPDEYTLMKKKVKVRESTQDVSARAREALVDAELDLQKNYFEWVRGIHSHTDNENLDTEIETVCRRVRERVRKERLTEKQCLRHWFYLSEVYIQLLKQGKCRQCNRRCPEEIRGLLHRLSNASGCLMLRHACLFNYWCLGFYLLKYVKMSYSSQDYVDILSELETLGRQDKILELKEAIRGEITTLQMRAIKILVARPMLFTDRRGDKNIIHETNSALLREPDGWFTSCIEQVEHSERIDRRSLEKSRATMTVSVDTLTPERLEKYLREDCLVMFLRVDVEANSVLFEAARDKDVVRVQGCRMSLDEFRKTFEFHKVKILVVFGSNVSRLDIRTGGYIIYVELKYPEEKYFKQPNDPVRDPHSFAFHTLIHNQYCESFLPSFVEALLENPYSQNIADHIEEASLAAHHVCLCDLADKTSKDSDLSKYVSLSRKPGTEQFELTIFTHKLGGSIIKRGSCFSLPKELHFTTFGWQQNMARLLADLASPGLFNLHEGFNHQCEMLCRELHYLLRRAGEKKVTFVVGKDFVQDLLQTIQKVENHVVIAYIGDSAIDLSSDLLTDSIKKSNNRIVLGTLRKIQNETRLKNKRNLFTFPLFIYDANVTEQGFCILMQRQLEKRPTNIKISPSLNQIKRYYGKGRKEFQLKYLRSNGTSTLSNNSYVPALRSEQSQPGRRPQP